MSSKPHGIQEAQDGIFKRDIDAFEDNFDLGMTKMTEEELENCIKGRLTALYKMAIVWNKNQQNLVSESRPDPRFSTPCKMFWLRYSETLSY